jgi:hypothetical protein
MKTIELRPREFHRRIRWALAKARRGVALIVTAPGQPAVTLPLGRPEVGPGTSPDGVDWDAHFAWLASPEQKQIR